MTFKIVSIFQKLKATVITNKKVGKLFKNQHFQVGGPIVCLVVLCFFLIKESQTVRFEFRKVKIVSRKEWEKMGVKFSDKPYSLEEEYEKIKDKDFNDWENKRIPRPEGWE